MNYTIQTGNPGESFQQGMQQTAGMMATVADYQKAQAMATAAQQKAEHDAYKRQRFMQVTKNPTSKDVQGLLLEFPELHEGLSKSLELMSADEKKNTQQMAFSVLSALEKGKGDSAITVIDQQLEAAKRSNNQEQVQRLEMLRDSAIAARGGRDSPERCGYWRASWREYTSCTCSVPPVFAGRDDFAAIRPIGRIDYAWG